MTAWAGHSKLSPARSSRCEALAAALRAVQWCIRLRGVFAALLKFVNQGLGTGGSVAPALSCPDYQGMVGSARNPGCITLPGQRKSRAPYSAAPCRGLIEARSAASRSGCSRSRIPRLRAAASLKQRVPELQVLGHLRYSAAPCRGLIEAARPGRDVRRARRAYSAAPCRGLIEAVWSESKACSPSGYSAAPCRGLIEAEITADAPAA